jgi:hypothetical protein
MRLNLVKQSLFPAFLTLLTLIILTMCNLPEGIVAEHPAGTGEATEVATDTNLRYGFSESELPIMPLGRWIEHFQHRHPTISHWLGGFLLLFTGISLGRLTVRYNLYGSGTCLAISLYGMLMIVALHSANYLPTIILATLTALAIKNLCMSQRNGFGFDRIFRGGIFLALTVLVEPTVAPLWIALPMAVTHFRRTTRETIVAISGLLFPIALLCYLNWALGGALFTPIVALYRAFMAGEWLQAIYTSTLLERCIVGTLLLLVAFATILFRTNSYNVNIKARHIMLFTCRLFWLLPTLFLLPAASPMLLAVTIVLATLILPVLFVRIHQPLAQTLYLVLLVGAIALLFVG